MEASKLKDILKSVVSWSAYLTLFDFGTVYSFASNSHTRDVLNASVTVAVFGVRCCHSCVAVESKTSAVYPDQNYLLFLSDTWP